MTQRRLHRSAIGFSLAIALVLGASSSGALGFQSSARSSRPSEGAPAETPAAVNQASPTYSQLPPQCTLPDPWANKTAYPLQVYGAAVAADGTYAYAFGGNTIGGAAHDEVYRYDPATNVWTPRASMAAGADYLFHAEYGENGKIYVQAGWGGGSGSTLNRIYDIATNSWSTGAAVPAATYDHAHAYANGKIYMIGGIVDGVADATVRTYDVATDTWGTVAPLPQAQFNMAAGVIGNKIYVAGGSTGTNQLNNLWIYDIAGNSWSAGPGMSTSVNFAAGAVIGSRFWVIGGGNPFGPANEPSGPNSFAVTQIYDPVGNSWSPGPDINQARSFMDAVTLNTSAGQLAVVVGGFNSTIGASVDTVEANSISCAGGLFVGSALTMGYPPNNYGYLATNFVNYTFANSRDAASEFAIFQTHDPWNSTVVKSAITGAGRTYSVFTPAQLPGFNFAAYRVVVLNWDDHFLTDFNPYYESAIPALEAFVRGGGVLWFQGSIQGSGGEKTGLPFGGIEVWDESDSDYVSDPGSALVTGAPNPIVGNHASHAHFENLNAGSHIVVKRTNTSGPPVLYELRLRGGTPYDKNHDLKTDRTVFRPSNGVWYSALSDGTSTAVGWGVGGDIDVMGDYDGDGMADIAVFRPSSGTWLIIQSMTGTVRADTWGVSGDIPFAGDIDGDGKDDLIVFRPSAGVWFIKRSTGPSEGIGWGVNGDIPFVGDFNGDGELDIIAYRPGTGVWYVLFNGGGTTTVGWGTGTDIPVLGDFDGDRRIDPTVFRPSTGVWFVLKSTGGTKTVPWGLSGDVPIAGDFDGDGFADFTVWRPSNGVWFTQFTIGGSAAAGWGIGGDQPSGRVPGS